MFFFLEDDDEKIKCNRWNTTEYNEKQWKALEAVDHDMMNLN